MCETNPVLLRCYAMITPWQFYASPNAMSVAPRISCTTGMQAPLGQGTIAPKPLGQLVSCCLYTTKTEKLGPSDSQPLLFSPSHPGRQLWNRKPCLKKLSKFSEHYFLFYKMGTVISILLGLWWTWLYITYVTYLAQCLAYVGNCVFPSTSLPYAFKILIFPPHERKEGNDLVRLKLIYTGWWFLQAPVGSGLFSLTVRALTVLKRVPSIWGACGK